MARAEAAGAQDSSCHGNVSDLWRDTGTVSIESGGGQVRGVRRGTCFPGGLCTWPPSFLRAAHPNLTGPGQAAAELEHRLGLARRS